MIITRAFAALAVILVCAAAITWLQVFLSKRDGKWPGLILPILSFLISLSILLAGILFSVATVEETVMVNGEIINQHIHHTADASAIVTRSIFLFFICNIPTIVLLAIYAACRSKRERQRALEKMAVHDLE